MALLSCKDLSLGYDGKTVVKDINFSVERGDYLCIVGENGSGKSTLMKTILGLMKPLSGQIETDGELQSGKIGYLPQQTEIQKDFPACVREIVLSGCLSGIGKRPFYTKKEKQKAKEMMERVGISDIACKCYRELSGGQQQKVLLARALCSAESLIFLDEPVAGLDPHAMADMYGIINKLNNDGVTVIMISHDIACSVKYASHVLHIGQTPLYFGSKEGYLESEAGKKYLKEEHGGHKHG